ncbi:conserved hypothetical protein [Paraburkholderia ribeironis]|uniref:Uncharacterized protein n=1 Tax=Paraburkholderia ribeironis TaxID=1247936 RepID=A0A1N7SFV1_9BURK|nr:conserved hypothetical protein [Paraburkholderia ribeironis]
MTHTVGWFSSGANHSDGFFALLRSRRDGVTAGATAGAAHPTRHVAMKTLVMILLAVSLAGCVVYPARPVYYRPAFVVY